MNIVLFGPPGSGKGTQADNIVQNFNLFKISTGDLLREEIKNKTNLGIKIKEIIEKGLLVSDNIVNELIKKVLSNLKKESVKKGLIFDGYPRNLKQAENLDKITDVDKISCVLNLKVEKEIIIKRILGRQMCTNCGLIFNEYFNPASKSNHKCGSSFLKKRSDDNEKTIAERYETYLDITLPILDFYKRQKILYEINGKEEIGEIFRKIRVIITSLQA